MVVRVYKPSVFQPTLEARPRDIMSTTEMRTLTNTRGKTMAFNARINMSPTKPIHCKVTSLVLASSGSHNERPTPNPTPQDAYVRRRTETRRTNECEKGLRSSKSHGQQSKKGAVSLYLQRQQQRGWDSVPGSRNLWKVLGVLRGSLSW